MKDEPALDSPDVAALPPWLVAHLDWLRERSENDDFMVENTPQDSYDHMVLEEDILDASCLLQEESLETVSGMMPEEDILDASGLLEEEHLETLSQKIHGFRFC